MTSMQQARRAISLFIVCIVFAAFGPDACATPNTTGTTTAAAKTDTAGATASCGGKDMLAEFAITDPVRHRKIEDAAARSENTEAIFWHISKPGTAPSYLFGTIHLTDPRVTKLSPSVTSALKNASTLALEVADLSPTAMAQALAAALKLAIYSDGRSLKTKLSPEEYAIVERKLKSSGMPVQMAQVFRPWVVTMLLSSSDCERRRAARGKRVLDMQLAELAKKNNVPVIGLETISGQMQALSAIPNQDQLAMLKAGLPYVDRSNDLIETLIQIYLKRKIGATWPFQIALAEKAGISAASFNSFRRLLILQRNRQMRDKAVPLIEKGGAFIAVGALHLAGKNGLVALLRKAGFKITAVE